MKIRVDYMRLNNKSQNSQLLRISAHDPLLKESLDLIFSDGSSPIIIFNNPSLDLRQQIQQPTMFLIREGSEKSDAQADFHTMRLITEGLMQVLSGGDGELQANGYIAFCHGEDDRDDSDIHQIYST